MPGTIHTDLMAVKAIPDPNQRDNEKWVQWVSNMDWEYKSEFELLPDIETKQNVQLVFKGLDTYAEVFLNGKSILSSDNMFLEHRIDVKSLLKKGKNEIRIVFISPLKAALPELAGNKQVLPAINDAMPLKTSPYTRKAGYHYGWDWGPRLVTSGIWRPVTLEGFNDARIENVFLETSKIDKLTALLKGNVTVDKFSTSPLSLKIQIGKKLLNLSITDLKSGTSIVPFQIQIDKPELWWTNGLGKPHLYDVQVLLLNGSKRVDVNNFHFGIRTVEVIHEMDASGKSFYFKLNGLPVFMKGANYIPQDNFLPEVSDHRYRKLLSAAKDANMNMLRVWGGGIYENDVFYNLCDSLGLMVWQDMMFACTMYPGTEKFRNSVEAEVGQNIRRLRNHPSIALWCGNNENETGWLKRWMMGGIPYSKSDSTTIYNDHKVLFHTLIPKIINKEDPGRFYTRSSPSANDDGIAPDKKGFGDIHDWHVWFGSGDYRKYENNVSRFQSEYGFQSFPAMETIRKFSEERDWFEDSDVMDVHQKHTNGNSKIRKFASQFYPKPGNFAEFVYISQLQQAEAMRFAVETHRKNMPYCMGSLYWQLNDCWPAASWSSIDYYGKWKATHYFVKKANAQQIVVVRLNKDTVKTTLVNDALERLPVHSIDVKWVGFDGKVHLSNSRLLNKTESIGSMSSWTVKILKPDPGFTLDSFKTLVIVSVLDSKGKVLSRDHQYLKLPKYLSLPEVKLEKKLEEIPSGYRLTLNSSSLVKNLLIEIEAPDIHFSDNYFDVLPGESISLEIKTDKKLLIKDLSFSSLNDVLNRKP